MKRVAIGIGIAYFDCRKVFTVVDQAQWVGYATPIWPVMASKMVLKARSD